MAPYVLFSLLSILFPHIWQKKYGLSRLATPTRPSLPPLKLRACNYKNLFYQTWQIFWCKQYRKTQLSGEIVIIGGIVVGGNASRRYEDYVLIPTYERVTNLRNYGYSRRVPTEPCWLVCVSRRESSRLESVFKNLATSRHQSSIEQFFAVDESCCSRHSFKRTTDTRGLNP